MRNRSSDPQDREKLAHGSVMFIGTATTLIRYGGFTILTDPNFLHAGDHIHVGFGVIAERLTNPAIEIDDLPALDLCLLSHLHADHWDHVATEQLRKDLPVYTTHHAALYLQLKGFRNARGLSTWQTIKLKKGEVWLRVTSMPGRHGPGVMQAIMPPVMGTMLEWGTGRSDVLYRLYISGDTLAIDDLKKIPERYPGIDLALVHLGGTRLFGILVTMDAQQGIKAIRMVHPKAAIPIHYNDYPLFKSSIEEFARAVKQADLPAEIIYLVHGESYDFSVELDAESLRRSA